MKHISEIIKQIKDKNPHWVEYNKTHAVKELKECCICRAKFIPKGVEETIMCCEECIKANNQLTIKL